MSSIDHQPRLLSKRLVRFALQILICVAVGGFFGQTSLFRPGKLLADDWLTWPSTYTHDPSGHPIDQYARPVQPIAPSRDSVVRSGYRHFRSTLQVGQSADNMHIVEQWGQQVVPYEEWRFPFRPYGVPYDAWGPPVGLGGWGAPLPWFPAGPGFPGGAFPGAGFPGANLPGNGVPNAPGNPNFPGNFWRPGYWPGIPLQPQYQGQPWFDGTYPSAPPLDPSSDQEFFYRPQR